MRERFWERFSLGELNQKEWEALCDGCGQCCLIRYVDDKTQEMILYGIGCEMLDIAESRCIDYENRLKKVPSCHKLTPTSVPKYNWLPDTCAYRRLYQGKKLPSWHPLIVGNKSQMERQRITISSYAVPQQAVRKRHMKRHEIARFKLTA